MGRTFSKARLVISWLGDEADDSSCVMEAIRATTHVRKYSFKVDQAVKAFAKRLFWRRMWVIQEFVLARDLVLLCGHEGELWEKLFHFWNDEKLVCRADGSHRYFTGSSVSSVGEGGMAALISARHSRSDSTRGFLWDLRMKPQPIPVDEIMTRFAYGECSDPRDRIYALLTLLNPQEGVEPLSADYRISAEHLYDRVLGYVWLLGSSDWGTFRKKLREALGSVLWAGAETAKLHELVCEFVEMDFDEQSFSLNYVHQG